MAVLSAAWLGAAQPKPAGRGWARLGLFLLLLACTGPLRAQPAPVNEYEIKALFLFNFAQFVEWPPEAFADPAAPLVIGVLGDDPFRPYLDRIASRERVNGRALRVQRYSHIEEVAACHVLFISRSEFPRLEPDFARLAGRSILTVGDAEGFAQRGGMIRFVMENNRIRFRINVTVAKAAGLILSSKLLRPAELITPGKD